MTDFPYIEVLDIIREGRNSMVSDSLNENSPDLYDALYSKPDSEISKIKFDLYELKWIEAYWESFNELLNRKGKNYSVKEKKEFIAKFSKWYQEFINHWEYSLLDLADNFEKREKILSSLIDMNSKWENDLKRMEVLFEKDINLLNNKIKELKGGESYVSNGNSGKDTRDV